MADNPQDWLALKLIASELPATVQLYFTTWSHYHEALRQAAISIAFPGGLAWIGFLMLKFPADRFKSMVGASINLCVLAILLGASSHSSKMYAGEGSGGPVANGTYWSWAIVGSVYKVFKSAIESAYTADLSGTGNRNERYLMMADNAGDRLAANFTGSPAYPLVRDYLQHCNKAVMNNLSDKSSREALSSVGLAGSNMLGTDWADTSKIASAYNAGKAKLSKSAEEWRNIFDSKYDTDIANLSPWGAVYGSVDGARQAKELERRVTEGKQLLSKIPPGDDYFARGESPGYTIPTNSYWEKKAGREAEGPEYHSAHNEDAGKYLQKGKDPSSRFETGTVEAFYPKSCSDAYELANKAALEFRESVKNSPDYKDNPLLGPFAATTATNALNNAANAEAAKTIEALGGKLGGPEGMTQAADTGYQWLNDLVAKIAEWLLRFKVPMVIGTSAMLAGVLLVAFPIFAVMSVFMGYKILVTYVKLLALTFLIVLLNDMFMGMASEFFLISELSSASSYSSVFGTDLSQHLAASTGKVLIFGSLTLIEGAVAKLLLWDDVKSIGNLSTGGMGISNAAAGAKVVGAAAITVATLGKGGAAMYAAKSSAAGSKAAALTKAMATTVGGVTKNMGATAGAAVNAGTGRQTFSGSAKLPNFTPPKPKKAPGTSAGGGPNTP